MKVYKIRKLSKKRAAQNRIYLKMAKEFITDKFCPVTGYPATEVHHISGRIGALLTDERYFLAVSTEGHRWIHENVKEARSKGWIK
jgi:hypothetical protein